MDRDTLATFVIGMTIGEATKLCRQNGIHHRIGQIGSEHITPCCSMDINDINLIVDLDGIVVQTMPFKVKSLEFGATMQTNGSDMLLGKHHRGYHLRHPNVNDWMI